MKTAQPPDPAQALAQRLADPQTAAALNTLLDHADLLAVLVTGLNDLVSRSDTITDSLASGVRDLGSVSESTRLNAAALATTARQLSALAPPLLDKLPVLEALLGSDLADPKVIEIASTASRALVTGASQAQAQDLKLSGVRGLLRTLKDPDVARALGFVVSIAKALGRELKNAG